MDGKGASSSAQTSTTISSKTPSQSGTTTGSDTEEDSESESESSSSSSKGLREFRRKWQEELSKERLSVGNKNIDGESDASSDQKLSQNLSTLKNSYNSLTDVEEEAKRLFLLGVGLERQGDLYDAVRFYRRSMQLVPDIEYRVVQNDTPSNEVNSNSPDDSDVDIEESRLDNFGEFDDEEKDLSKRFIRMIEANGWHFFKKMRPDSKVHLDDIPVEVLTYILRWVISDELDMRTVDVLSGVSRGFYCICRDDKLWRLACERVWGSTNGIGIGNEFSTYREMFISRPKVRLDGCYISKVTYVRPGEHSFQDQSYRPWHLVEYFRYLRFFHDGRVHFLTSSDPPAMTVSGFKDRTPKHPSTLQGRYKLYGANLVSMVVTKTAINYNKYTKAKSKCTTSTASFNMEFEIQQLRGKPNWVLRWTHYAVYMNNSNRPMEINRNRPNNNNEGGGVSTTFDLSQNKYPPLYFSRVKSYTNKSEKILQ